MEMKLGIGIKVLKNGLIIVSKLDEGIQAALDIANRQSPPNFINLPIQPLDN